MLLKAKISILISFILVGVFIVCSCKKDGNNQNQSPNNNDTIKNNLPAPVVSIAQTPVTILLPNNCSQSFTISNTGPKGSTLNYTVADDGALAGFLEFGNTSGALAAGTSVTIMVSVKPAFVNSTPSLVGAALILDVYTPKASNYTKIVVPVNIKSITSIAPSLIGTWAGTWTGTSYGANNPNQSPPSSPVSGTWTLNLKTIDTVGLTATGSLTWNGTDVYWSYLFDVNGLITTATPVPFIPNRTIQFDASNTSFSYMGSGCNSIQLTIQGFKNQPNPSDAFYGPWFSGNFDISSNTVNSAGVGFSTHPYAPLTLATFFSSGSISGKKQ